MSKVKNELTFKKIQSKLLELKHMQIPYKFKPNILKITPKLKTCNR